MTLLATLWSLLSIPIGVFCLFLAWRLAFQNNEAADLSDEEQIEVSDQELIEHFSSAPDDEPIEEKRALYFVILFSGLGIGAILVGLEILSPYFVYAGKLVFFLTILSSIMVPKWLREDDNMDKKDNGSENGSSINGEDNKTN